MARPASPEGAIGGPIRLRKQLLRTLQALEREIETGLAHPILSTEEVHDVHRELRRLASGLTVWGQLIAPAQREAVREVSRRVRRLARLVGRVRDRDVTTALLVPARRLAPTDDEPDRWSGFLGRLREDTHTSRELLRAFLRTERQAGLFDRARALLELALRADARRGLQRILTEERRRRQGKVRRAHRKARRDPTSERLHRLRIRIRQWRHLASLELAARATANHPPPPSWRALQDRLGRLHDLDVAIATVPDELADAGPAQGLKERRRKLRRSVRVSLERIASRPERAAARARQGIAR
jgi:CHAD domain-containing protein